MDPYGPVQACKDDSSTFYLPVASEVLKYADTLTINVR